MELADRDAQPVAGPDLDDGVGGEIQELADAQPSAGQELDGEADERVLVGPRRDEQLGEGRVIDEPGQRPGLDRRVVGDDQLADRRVGRVLFLEPIEQVLQHQQPAVHGALGERRGAVTAGPRPAPGRRAGGEVEREGLDVLPAQLGK